MENILIIEDDIEIHSQLKKTLNNYCLIFATSLAEGKKHLHTKNIDLIILDISLPDGDGLTFFMDLHSEKKHTELPVIFLSAKDQTSDKVAGLSLGAEDYVTKPFDRMELKARVALRISKTKKNKYTEHIIEKNDIHFDILKQKVSIGGNDNKTEIDLTALEFKLLLYFAKHEDQVLSRRHLLDSVWGKDMNVIDRTIDAHTSNLRRKIKESCYTIKSIYGEGYQFTKVRHPSKKIVA